MSIRVMVADDVFAVRRGLELAVKAFEDMQLVGVAADGREAIELCLMLAPDVILLDADMPHLCSVAVARFVNWLRPATQVIGMMAFDDDEMTRKLLVNGVADCVLKNISAEELSHTIRRAHQRREPTPAAGSPMPTFPCPGSGCPRHWRCSD